MKTRNGASASATVKLISHAATSSLAPIHSWEIPEAGSGPLMGGTGAINRVSSGSMRVGDRIYLQFLAALIVDLWRRLTAGFAQTPKTLLCPISIPPGKGLASPEQHFWVSGWNPKSVAKREYAVTDASAPLLGHLFSDLFGIRKGWRVFESLLHDSGTMQEAFLSLPLLDSRVYSSSYS